MRHVLRQVEYSGRDETVVGLPDPLIVGPAPLMYETGERPSRRAS
jgi:hypothetical protein